MDEKRGGNRRGQKEAGVTLRAFTAFEDGVPLLGLKQGSEIQLQGPNRRQKCGVSKVSEESEREMRA